jgi:hypothetical protein
MGCGIGHPWGALGLLFGRRDGDICYSDICYNECNEKTINREEKAIRPSMLSDLRGARRSTLVSRRDDTVLLGCFGI